MRSGGRLSEAVGLTLALSGCFTEAEPLTNAGSAAAAGDSASGSAGTSAAAGAGGGAGSGGSAANTGGSAAGGAGGSGTGGSGTGGAGTGGSGASGSGTGGAGTAGTGGSGAGGSGATGGMCASALPCGGDLTGTWTVSSSCLVVKGELDVTGLGLGCASVGLRGSRVVAGTFTANADGTYTDQTTTSGEELLEVPDACLSVSGTLVTCDRLAPVFSAYGYDTVTCQTDGGGCRCNALFEQTGVMGVSSQFSFGSGIFQTSDDIVTLFDPDTSPRAYAYCVSDSGLTLTPAGSETNSLRGRIDLARQ